MVRRKVYFNILGFRFNLTEIPNRFTEFVRVGLAEHEPLTRVARETAAVAVILKANSKQSDEFLLIRRADRAGDPWSGQVAFPGGRVEVDDPSFKATATRETLEEVGFDLAAKAEFLGYMGPLEPRNRRIQVVPAVFGLTGVVKVLPSQEVSSHRWIPVTELISGKNRSQHALESGTVQGTVPSFRFGDYLVWGLTERILTRLADFAEST
jgi:8-oxo-dGTP pyrophosphatase MutT (NUDIX family)